mgnify:CR=1 FL=1
MAAAAALGGGRLEHVGAALGAMQVSVQMCTVCVRYVYDMCACVYLCVFGWKTKPTMPAPAGGRLWSVAMLVLMMLSPPAGPALAAAEPGRGLRSRNRRGSRRQAQQLRQRRRQQHPQRQRRRRPLRRRQRPCWRRQRERRQQPAAAGGRPAVRRPAASLHGPGGGMHSAAAGSAGAGERGCSIPTCEGAGGGVRSRVRMGVQK